MSSSVAGNDSLFSSLLRLQHACAYLEKACILALILNEQMKHYCHYTFSTMKHCFATFWTLNKDQKNQDPILDILFCHLMACITVKIQYCGVCSSFSF